MEAILKQHAARYPLMQPQDAVKLIYQNEFGGGHLIADEGACLEYLRREHARTPTQAPYIEDLGNGILRVYLGGVTDVEKLGRAFIKSAAAHVGSPDSFLKKLDILREVTKQGIFAFSFEELEKYLKAYKKTGCTPVSHSKTYRAAYRPAYRVIRKEYL